MTDARWRYTNLYARSVFGEEDDVLQRLTSEAEAAGIPNWGVSADVGRLLRLLASMTPGRLALEIGTLAGYSAIWISRGLAPQGRLLTIESDDRHADFAVRQLAAAGLADRVELLRGDALAVLPSVAEELGDESVDFVFVDADKRNYPHYFTTVRPLIAPGGLLVVDNAFGSSTRWIDDLSDPNTKATDQMNRMVAADPGFEATAVAARSGILIARRIPA